MNVKSFTIAYHICLVLCTIITLVLVFQSLSKYMLDENSTRVNHIKFNHGDPGNIYPSITLCVFNPFLEKELKRYREDINITTYFSFLKGKLWDEQMMSIDYDKVTVSLMNNLIGVRMTLANGSRYEYDHIHKKQSPAGWMPRFYITQPLADDHAYMKCLSYDIPFIDKSPVRKFHIYLKKSLFPQQYENQPFKFESNESGMRVQFHYPGQRIASKITVSSWSSSTKLLKPYTIGFRIFDINVMAYRNRKREPCVEDWLNYDQMLTDEKVMKAGCRPRYWITNKILPICNTQGEMQRVHEEIGSGTNWKTRPPCKMIRSMQYTCKDDKYSERIDASEKFFDLKGTPNRSYFGVTVRFPELDFKETRQVKAFDYNDLLGNIGGYIGMFLGYALLNLAYYLVDLFGKFIARCCDSVKICAKEKRDGFLSKISIVDNKKKISKEPSKEMQELRDSIDDMNSRLRIMERKFQ